MFLVSNLAHLGPCGREVIFCVSEPINFPFEIWMLLYTILRTIYIRNLLCVHYRLYSMRYIAYSCWFSWKYLYPLWSLEFGVSTLCFCPDPLTSIHCMIIVYSISQILAIYYILCIVHYILYIVYYILYTIYYVLYTIYYMLYTIYYLLHTMYYILYTICYAIYNLQYTVHWILYTMDWSVHI